LYEAAVFAKQFLNRRDRQGSQHSSSTQGSPKILLYATGDDGIGLLLGEWRVYW